MDDIFNSIPNINQRMIMDLESGEMTVREAARLACRCGVFNYVPSEKQLIKWLREYEERFPFSREQFAQSKTKH